MPAGKMNYRSYADLASDIRGNAHRLQQQPFDLVVGVPRSGMIPAYMIASLLNINCVDLQTFLRNAPVLHGMRRRPRYPLDRCWQARHVLLVDDSTNTGMSMHHARASIPGACPAHITRLAVYASDPQTEAVDLYLQHLPLPRLFQWNLYHHVVLQQAAVDIDGVLCRDPQPHENDDGPAYETFLRTAEPLILPSYPIAALVTSRLEKYRPQTEDWLRRHGICYRELVMLDLPDKATRQRLNAHATHKAEYYGASNLALFIESSSRQARAISRATGRPVFCTEDDSLHAPGLGRTLLNGRRYRLRQLALRCARRLPPHLFEQLRRGYRSWRGRSSDHPAGPKQEHTR